MGLSSNAQRRMRPVSRLALVAMAAVLLGACGSGSQMTSRPSAKPTTTVAFSSTTSASSTLVPTTVATTTTSSVPATTAPTAPSPPANFAAVAGKYDAVNGQLRSPVHS